MNDSNRPEANTTEFVSNSQQQSGQNFQQTPTTPNVMAIIAYLGPLCFVPYLTAKDDDFAYFHAKQGVALFIAQVVLNIAMQVFVNMFFFGFFTPFHLMFALLSQGLFFAGMVLSIVGIVNAVNKKLAPLPVIGGFVR